MPRQAILTIIDRYAFGDHLVGQAAPFLGYYGESIMRQSGTRLVRTTLCTTSAQVS